ncbi:DnaJ domain-containing protein [Spongorhabdus nitratireducens]
MIIILLLGLIIAWWLYGLYREGKLSRLQLLLIIAFVVGVSLLVAGPRGALTGLLFGIVPLLRRGLSLAMWASTLKSLFGRRAASSAAVNPGQVMTVEEARELLGVDEQASRQDIIDAHRKLISKVHPDKGGTSGLAARLNQARDCLLNNMPE